ncbi:hypothetical protein MGYG_00059 [Nannizzia gypsea CBS 118893]|uniref:ORC6 first cyclin-like domain-containing protein n=1 Tax=Arthroderma gypseum (strain ATCC MYA-4604 / CBS 118893) TaxID=535722 RepID=E5R2C6_ARTGP|nr:hypothetical protein MGYG_00059 [Nannizzia gypsea CBS 118893]EFQ97016.1 hypothetical protein MGYG_00059 [Nannizzia gypsea CBS 118893]
MSHHRSIEQALASLLPAHAEDLPRELLNLAASLLTQTRSCGATLKPEMEIARPYACAEIACKRLARTLKLPSPLSRPPCPPRVYKKLYAYIEQSLQSSSASSKRQDAEPQAQKRASVRKQNKATAPPALPTPTATSSAISSPRLIEKTGNGRNHVSSKLLTGSSPVVELPQWTMGQIRTICKTLPSLTRAREIPSPSTFASALPPHIYSGLCSVISLISTSEARLTEKWNDFVSPVLLLGKEQDNLDAQTMTNSRVTTLNIAIYFVVYARRIGVVYDAETQQYPNKPLAELNEEDMEETVGRALDSVSLPRLVDGIEKFAMEVESWLMIMLEMGWAIDQQWFENIPLPTAEEIEAYNQMNKRRKRGLGEDSDFEEDEEDILSPKRKMVKSRSADAGRRYLTTGEQNHYGDTLLPGLGTMMHPQVDWLSEDKRYSYGTWKDRIMMWIEQVEI